jgi:DNA-binding HxlR family transcriptional regulator
MAKHNEMPDGCAMGGLLETLTKPWTLHILWSLRNHGEMRFGALRRSIDGISSRMLTERLRGLEENNFVYRDYKPTIPPQVSYGPTEKLKEIEKIMDQLHDLAIKWRAEETRQIEKKTAA